MTNKIEKEAHVVMPRQDAFEGKHVIEGSIIHSGQKYLMYEKTGYPPEGGIYVYYKGCPYPKKGFPFPEAVWGNDIVKRTIMTMVKMVATKRMALPILGFLLIPWKTKIKILENVFIEIDRIAAWHLAGFYLTENRYSNSCRVLRKLSKKFLLEIGLSESTSGLIAKTVATIFEYDDAYRYRLQDLFTATAKGALIRYPRKAVKIMISVFSERELAGNVKDTLKYVSFALTYALLHPKIRRAFVRTIESISHEEYAMLQLDNADRYHVLSRGDYNFLGKTLEERKNMYIDFHTHSKCCNAGIVERRIGDTEWETICKKCGRKCEYYQDFPPEVEVASYKK